MEGIEMEKYSLTEEHRAQLKPWADKWIANAMSTKQMDDEEKRICIDSVNEMYRIAGLEPPKNTVFVESPYIGRFASGYAATILWRRRNNAYLDESTRAATDDATDAATRAATLDAIDDATDAAIDAATRAATRAATGAATRDATYAATGAATGAATRAATDAATRAATDDATRAATLDAIDDATDAATDDATDDATDAATRAATYAATRAATYAATDAATRAATRAATDAATRAATYAATRAATLAATEADIDAATTKNVNWFNSPENQLLLSELLGVGLFGLKCVSYAWRFAQCGNQWSAYESFLSFFQDVVKLPIDYSKYQPWRNLAEHSGYRFVHADFCIICDRPEVLLVDEFNRPHCEDGPFCRYTDGFSMYAWHGIRVPQWIIESPELITVSDIDNESDQEIRRVMIEIKGMDWYIEN
jgi:hypothetical protein